MKRLDRFVFLVCGLLLTLAAFPVFAQQENRARDLTFNEKPFQDFVESVKEKIDKKQVDLTKPFAIELEGTLDKSGRLDPKTTKFIKIEGDEKTASIAKSFVEAVNASGFFIYLKQLGVDKINLALAQDDSRIYASVASELATPQRAKTTASGLNMMFQIARTKSEQARGIGEEEKILIGGAKALSADKTLTIKLDYEKSVIQELINRKLNGEAQK